MFRLSKAENAGRDCCPPWLIEEQVSLDGAILRDEWTKLAASSDEQDGQSRLASAMLLLRSQRPNRPLLAQANARALRWVDSMLSRSRAAQRLRRTTPKLPWQHRFLLRMQQWALPVAATVVIFICRAGMFRTMQGVGNMAEKMAKLHHDRHIEPPIV